MITGYPLYANNFLDICHDACRICYKSTPKGVSNIETKLKYIEDKVKVGHESILEHSNYMILLTMTDVTIQEIKHLSEVQAASRHLQYVIKEDGDNMYVLISGNIRAYKNIYRNIKSGVNMVLNVITQMLKYLPAEFFYDFIEAGLFTNSTGRQFNKYYFTSMEEYDKIESDRFSVVGHDDPKDILKQIRMHTVKDLFKVDDLLDCLTVSVHVHNMSRVISQQLTRHRNAISQMSQRYVTENDDIFELSDELMDLNIDGITNREFSKMSLDRYNVMRDNKINKEMARYFITQNTNTELYVTFTLRNLLHFIDIRDTKRAQEEIREFAHELNIIIEELYSGSLPQNFSFYLIPKYMLSEIEDYNPDGIIYEDNDISTI